jgi:hypothetical protein
MNINIMASAFRLNVTQIDEVDMASIGTVRYYSFFSNVCQIYNRSWIHINSGHLHDMSSVQYFEGSGHKE